MAVTLSTLELTPERLRVWGIRSGISILDQGLTSGAGFLLNLLLARWLTGEAYGAFAVTFTTVLFIAGFQNVLVLEPMSVFGPSNYVRRMPGYFAGQIKVHAVLVGILSALLLGIAATMMRMRVSEHLVLATAGSAVTLPFILLLWLVRRMCYVVHRPSAAVLGSAIYLVCVLTGLFALHQWGWLTPWSAFFLMAATSIPATLLLLWRLGVVSPDLSNVSSLRDTFRENWRYGRWLVASTTLYSATSQTQTYLTAGFLGLGASGIFRAMQIPSLVMTQIIIAMSLFVLPIMARQFGVGHIYRLRKSAVLASLLLTIMSIAYAGALAIFCKPIESALFGGKYSASAWLIPILGLVPVCVAFGTGFSMALRASQQSHLDLLANVISAVVGLVTAVVFIKIWGLPGAAVSLIAGYAAYSGAFCWAFVRWAKKDVALSEAAVPLESPV